MDCPRNRLADRDRKRHLGEALSLFAAHPEVLPACCSVESGATVSTALLLGLCARGGLYLVGACAVGGLISAVVDSLFGRLAVEMFVVGLCIIAGMVDDAVPMIRRRIERIELQWNIAGIDDVVISSCR